MLPLSFHSSGACDLRLQALSTRQKALTQRPHDRASDVNPRPGASSTPAVLVAGVCASFPRRRLRSSGRDAQKGARVLRHQLDRLTEKGILEDLKVADLKAELRQLGLKVSGRKAELQERLLDAFSSAQQGDDIEAVRSGATLPPEKERPGYKDRAVFSEGMSVSFWRHFDPQEGDLLEGVSLLGEDAPYWLYHLGRTGFFATQGLASVAAANIARSLAGQEAAAPVTPRFLDAMFASPNAFIRRAVRQAVETFRQDLGYIKAGYFKAPYDMSPGHRQFSPAYVADKGLRYLREAVGTLQRSADRADTGTWVDSSNDLYPPYYRHTFHYQTDGWLSSESAQVYEASTETLFLGRQDAMQRSTLVHIAKHLDGTAPGGRGKKLLEIACGTGRVMTFIRDNWPAMDVTASDLSPYYLEEARKNNAYWERRFAPKDGAPALGTASFVQANAEALPFEAGTFDIVASVYLFHELPAEAQDAVVAEAARVLAPGGLFVLTDSVQLGDLPWQDNSIDNFGNFAEPHYPAYVRRDLAELAMAHGLQPVAKEVSSATKSLSFVKPMEGVVAERNATESAATETSDAEAA